MKLLYCLECGDVFNLQLHEKTCGCGKVKGRYTSREEAEVNGEGVSLGIGNGSLNEAVLRVLKGEVTTDFRKEGDVRARHPSSIICWARPHEGPANSHTWVKK